MTPERITATHQKALQINLDPLKYGSMAEIGAGQEVARWFFRAGGAAGTIARSISAYDMTISDSIYGPSPRYVSRQRLQTMLDFEYKLLIESLDAKRGDRSHFFAFANTVAAHSYSRKDEGQGWLGVKFQTQPHAAPSEIIIHVKMMDTDNTREQEALGMLGVNLIYGACYHHGDPLVLLRSLMDELGRERVEVDMISFSGPDFSGTDNRLMAVHLVNEGHTDVAMFTADGEVVQIADALYKKPILVERGSFRPVTRLTMDILECARQQFVQDTGIKKDEAVVLMEITMKNLLSINGGVIDVADFLARVDILVALGKDVLISKYPEYYHLAEYLAGFPNKGIGIALGIPALKEMLDEKYYAHLQGGVLESAGRLFKKGLRLYVHPTRDLATGKLIAADNLETAPEIQSLYRYLLENRKIVPIRGYEESALHIFPKDVLALIQKGDPAWKGLVPPLVAQMIEQRGLFGYQPTQAAGAH